MKALHALQSVTNILRPAAYTTTQSVTIDLANCLGNAIHVFAGTKTDGTFTAKLQEGDDSGGSGATDVAAADYVGALGALASNTDYKISYIGSKRYLTLVITVTGSPSTGCLIAAKAILDKRKK